MVIYNLTFRGSSDTSEPSQSSDTSDGSSSASIDEQGNKTITTQNPDGSTTKTTTKPDGSSQKIETSSDGNTITTTEIMPDGTEAVITESKAGSENSKTITESITLSQTAITKAAGSDILITMPAIPANDLDNRVELSITLPESGQPVNIEIPVLSGTLEPGSIALTEEETGALTPIIHSLGKDGVLIIPLEKSQKIVIKDNSLKFADVTTPVNNYPAQGIAFLSARRLMTGVGDGVDFDLTGKVTRAQLATILYRYNGSPDTSDLALSEGADPAGYYANAAKWAVANKLMAVGSNFNAADLLTREQLAMILWRMEGNPNPGTIDLDAYQDTGSISSPEMQKAVGWAVNTGLMGKGTSKLNASGSSQRQELAAMLSRYLMK